MVLKVDGKSKLAVLENFNIDYNLSKHKRNIKLVTKTVTSGSFNNSTIVSTVGSDDEKESEPQINPQEQIWSENPQIIEADNPGVVSFSPFGSNTVTGVFVNANNNPDALSLSQMIAIANTGFFGKLWIKTKYYWNEFLNLFKKPQVIEDTDYVPLLEFFADIPFKKLNQSKELVKYYEDALLHVEKTGQYALKDKLKNILNVVKAEILLLDNDLVKYVLDEQIVELFTKLKSDSKLKLTWIRNFVKIIPSDVLKLKEKTDELGVFDNYVILHFDPNNDATALTEAEKKAKEDPILFGVIQNSNKLYYVADWVDDYCDLTLEKMFETLGGKALEINNQSVKSYINAQQ